MPARAPPRTPWCCNCTARCTFEFAGYYAALWKGFYQEAGLAVEIRPGGTSGGAALDPARELAEGRAQFGTGTMQLIIRAAQGLPLLLVAPIFQESGAAIYYRTDTDFSSPAALVRARVGRLPASEQLSRYRLARHRATCQRASTRRGSNR